MDEQIFISHSTKDDATVKKLRELLELAGFTTWVDSRQLGGGDLLDATLNDKISRAKAIGYKLSDFCGCQING